MPAVKTIRFHKEKIFAVQGFYAPARQTLRQAYAAERRCGKFFIAGRLRHCKLLSLIHISIKASVKNTEGAVTWTSSDEKVATVTASEDGLTATVTGLSTGSVTVTAAVDGVSASCEFNVKSKSSSGGGGSPSGGGSSNKDDSSNETSSDVSVNESGKAEFTAENVLELADSGENLTVSNKGVQAVVPNGILSGNSDEKLEITLTKVSEGTVKAAQEAAENYGKAEVIGGAESSAAIEIKAGENVILSYSTPVEITVDVDKTAVESKNVNLLTLAKVNGDGSLTYIGGNYSDGEFTALSLIHISGDGREFKAAATRGITVK